MKADWWRAWHGLVGDPKWTFIARRAAVARGSAFTTAVALLERASEAEKRGSIEGYDRYALSELAGIEPEKVEAIIDAMREVGVLSADRFTKWDKRQPQREREDPTAAERKRKGRGEKQGDQEASAGRTADVTPCHTMSRPESESESEKIRFDRDDSARERASEAALKIDERLLEVECRALVVGLPVSMETDFTPVLKLLAGGIITREDVLAGIREALELRHVNARRWSVFENFIRETAKDRLERAMRVAPAGVVLDLGYRRRQRAGPPRESNIAATIRQLQEIRAEDDAALRPGQRAGPDQPKAVDFRWEARKAAQAEAPELGAFYDASDHA
jgi:hypothetical protein